MSAAGSQRSAGVKDLLFVYIKHAFQLNEPRGGDDGHTGRQRDVIVMYRRRSTI